MTVRSNVIYGLFPSDIILRTAILQGLAEIKAEPGLLDFLLQALLKDALTVKQYGERELNDLKNWILNNEIAVTLGYHINQVKQPHVAIWLGAQEETQQIFGDAHDTSIALERIQWVTRRPPTMIFTPATYVQSTGTVTLPANLNTEQIHAGMRVLDRANNRVYAIEEVIDEQSFKLPDDTIANLTNAEVLERDDLWLVKAESVTFKETFNIDCLVQGDATKAIVLHQLIVYILYRYKQAYLEGRGLENTVVTSTAMGGIQSDASQIIWKRSITLVGYTRQYWPKEISAPIQGISVGLVIPTPTVDAPPTLAEEQAWSTTQEEDAVDFDADTLGQIT